MNTQREAPSFATISKIDEAWKEPKRISLFATGAPLCSLLQIQWPESPLTAYLAWIGACSGRGKKQGWKKWHSSNNYDLLRNNAKLSNSGNLQELSNSHSIHLTVRHKAKVHYSPIFDGKVHSSSVAVTVSTELTFLAHTWLIPEIKAASSGVNVECNCHITVSNAGGLHALRITSVLGVSTGKKTRKDPESTHEKKYRRQWQALTVRLPKS